MKFNCILWWWIFNLFFGYCHLSVIVTTTQYVIPILKTFRWWINISILDILWFTTCSFILVITIWIYLINVIIILSFPPDLIFLYVIVRKLNFYICPDLHEFNLDFIIYADIHIWQPHITLWQLFFFKPEEAYIYFLRMNLQLFNGLILILKHKNQLLMEVLFK